MTELEIYPGWDDQHAFIVMQWDGHRDSGHCLRGFNDRADAIAFAEGVAWATGWRLVTAEILPFDRRASA
ncbi:hypothetical protein [Salibaculum halophilum]|uniref:hypothetical protein n=1 Tax=Salibaculum halophilum TaxID=1914408 RepID=UPI000A0FA0B9|nr:hypothetical protein [Salibaculum halophilum]